MDPASVDESFETLAGSVSTQSISLSEDSVQHPLYQRRPNSGRLYSNAYIIILAKQRQRLISPGSIRNGFSLSISIAPETDDERRANRRRYRRLPTTIGLVPPPRKTSDSQNAATTASFSRNCDKTKGQLNARWTRGYRTRASHAARSSTGWRGQKARDAGNLLRRCTPVAERTVPRKLLPAWYSFLTDDRE